MGKVETLGGGKGRDPRGRKVETLGVGRVETLGTRLEIQGMVVGGETEIPFQRVILTVPGSERINHFYTLLSTPLQNFTLLADSLIFP